MSDYQGFLESKRQRFADFGIKPVYDHDGAFDYQRHVADYAVRKGRCAVFLDTGLGKTLVELIVAQNYVRQFNKPALIITPLAVAFQFLKEAEKFGIDDIEYSRDGKHSKKIVICNYERLDKFDSSDFCAFVLDESSILKNFDGAIKARITAFLRKADYRFLFTATPSPNDFIELGTSSEALGHMGYMDMLKMFFANNENNIRPQEIGNKWYLKPHAEKAFFDWVSSWSISMRKPSDLGFDNSRHILPPLNVNNVQVINHQNWINDGQVEMFSRAARSLGEVREEQKNTINIRCEKAVELAHDKTSVYWCNFNAEGDLIQEIDCNAKQIKGSMNLEKKEELLLAFANGEISRLITKPKITSFGLNWQHCNHTVYFPTFSYEQYYQAIRRFWRFGQKREVTVERIYSDGQMRVIDALELKSARASGLFSKLNQAVNGYKPENKEEFDKQVNLPTFLGA